MRTVKEVSQLSGVTINTLHHYDKILSRSFRICDDNLQRLQEILLFRELEFPLKFIN